MAYQKWWWLSFADTEFRGAAIVQAPDLLLAVRRADELGINPGGEVCIGEITPEALSRFPPEDRHRLLNHAEAVKFRDDLN